MVVQMLTLRQMMTVMSNCIKLLMMVVVVAIVAMRVEEITACLQTSFLGPGADLNMQVLKICHCDTCPLRSHQR